MKILHITPSYKPAYIYGGPTMSISELCEWTAKIGHDVTVFTTTANGSHELDVVVGERIGVNGVWVYYYNRQTKDHTHFSFQLFYQLWRTGRNYDVVHIHSWWNLVAILSVLICLLKGIKPILSPRGMLSNYTLSKTKIRHLIHNFIGKLILKNVCFHVTSTLEATDIKSWVSPTNYFILYNFVALPKNFRRDPIKHDVTQFISLSRIHEKKGLEKTFQTLSYLKTPWKLMIIGNGEKRYVQFLKDLAVELSIDTNIEWLGTIQGEEKFSYLSHADYFILFSENENFANAVVESLSVGTPVIISDQVGLFDYIEKENFGWVSRLDKDNMLSVINSAVGDPEKCHFINKNSPEKIKIDFYSESLAQQYIKCYTKYLVKK